MKTLILTTFMAAGLMFAQSADENAVRGAHEEYVKAAMAGDANALGRLFADGLQYSHSNAKLETKKEAIDALVKTKPHFQVHEQSVVMLGKDAAAIRARVTAHGKDAATGKPTTTPISVLLVWTKQGGQWKLIQRQTTRLAS